tara:strand:- start:200 stop:778 length:579 start_codon:yes stop_codon:yes gene_type:complete
MVGIFDLKLIRPNQGVIKNVVKRNAIDTSSSGLLSKIISHFTASSGTSGIYLNPNFAYAHYSVNEGSGNVIGQSGIIATSPLSLGSYTGQGGDTEQDTTLCFKYNQTEDEASATKARWKAQATWTASDFEVSSIASLEGTSNYITDFKLGISLNAYLDAFDIPFASCTLTSTDRVQPALNDIIDITWTIEVS